MTRTATTLGLLALLLAMGCDDSRPPPSDGGPADAGAVDAGGGGDAGGVDAGGETVDAGPPLADIGLTFTGCSPDFSGTVVVIHNASSIAVTSTSGMVTGSLQLALEDAPGLVTLSTRHRVDSGSVINLIAGSTWTNIAMSSAEVLGGTVPDPIGGTIDIRTYDEAAGTVDVVFAAVTLQNPGDGSICQIDGRLQTFGLSF